jgi:cytochrome c oxidase assembly protein subunit 15
MSTWLLACCAMIAVMAVIGAVTRLTGSGLSITEWKPIMGAIPPLNEAEWQTAFTKYQQIPQYKIINSGISLSEFKNIFFWEWLHRLWGRLIGIVFAAPFLWFAVRRQMTKPLTIKLLAIFALGGLQGFIGWFMVQSGLEVRTSVSPYRLAIHLGLALLLYGLLLWVALGLRQERGYSPPLAGKVRGGVRHGIITLILLATTIVWGAFTAGLHAGKAYNTWPLMEGDVLPAAAWTLQPAWINAFENLALVQFIHRWLAPLTMIIILSWVVRLWRRTPSKIVTALGVMAIIQVALGLATLLTHTDITLATLHQAGAILLLTLVIVNLHRSRP